MKKVLLGTTAAVAALAITGAAQAADPLKLGIGGYFQAYGMYVSQDDVGTVANTPVSRRNFDLLREAEVWFLGSTKLDNGITVGVDVQLEAESCVDQIDESYVYFEGGFGKIILGSENAAPYLLSVTGPGADGNFDWIDPNYGYFASGNNGASTSFIVQFETQPGPDDEKITYLTPRFAGFQAGISYTPQVGCERNTGGAANLGCSGGFPNEDKNEDQYKNGWEFGLNYTGEFSGVKLALGGGYSMASVEADNTVTAGTANDVDNWRMWGGGLNVTYAGFSFGGYYSKDNRGIAGEFDDTAWQLGVGYATGPYTIGLSYTQSKREEGAAVAGVDQDDELKRWGLGGSYAMGPGVKLNASVFLVDLDGQDVTERNEATVITVGTNVTF